MTSLGDNRPTHSRYHICQLHGLSQPTREPLLVCRTAEDDGRLGANERRVGRGHPESRAPEGTRPPPLRATHAH
ncbi:hypothetical protein I79_016333 [Cricetulus griseus]|uniref:Uncharacterized protein n=1 Tax=Cricetulus griseus TaxID=10029 RepID=G3HZ37_CRIGR|nr:hypothetical protein I79_016333 [Cricetulus griseus]